MLPPPDATTTERHIGRYLLQEELGRGGMGVVYAAWDATLSRRVALKLLRFGDLTPPGPDGAAAERFAQEMRVAVTLEHPNIVPVYETGEEDGVHFIAMRLVEGEDLGAVIRRQAGPDGTGGGLAPGRVARLGRQLAAALDAAHARGLVHRDVKPGNVLLTGAGDEEHVYLTDFGLTREADGGVTQTGQWVGTVDYAAPEQIEAGAIGPRTDIYALGCVLFQALTGRLPYVGTFAAKATAHVTAPLPSVGTGVVADPSRIDGVLAMATAKDPARRHASAGALARAFARAVADSVEEAGQRTVAMAPITLDHDDADVADTGVDTVAAVVPDAAPATAEVPPDLEATAVRPRRPRAVATPLPPRPVNAETDGGARRSRLPLALAGLLAALLLGGVIALAMGGGGDDPAGRAARTSSSGSGSGSSSGSGKPASTGSSAGKSTSTAAAAAPAPAVVAKLPTTSYTAERGGYTAQVPTAWSAQGERDFGGVLRSVFVGPDGQQLWIDATPTMAPAFGRDSRTVTGTRTLDGPLGTITGYRFTGIPAEFCAGGCVDYQLDLGGHGYAVIAGPTPAARLAARTTIMSLKPTAAATPPAASTAPAPSTSAASTATPPAASTPAADAAPPSSGLPPGPGKKPKKLKPGKGHGGR